MTPALPIIYDYIDFRKYLEDYRQVRAEADKKFTHYYICHRLGMKNSRSYFNNIIRNRKNLSADTLQKVIDLLELPPDQASYFRALVNYNQTTLVSEKKYYLDQIISLNNTPRRIIDDSHYSYFTTWYHPVVRELLDTFDFFDDYRMLAQKIDPPITVRQAKESINLLVKLDLIEKNEHGYYKPNGRVIATPDNVQSHLVEQYQLLSLDRAKERIVNAKKGHKTTTLTLAVSKDALENILEHIAKLRSSVRSIAHKDDQTDKKVYEVIIHIHSQSK